MFKEIKHGTHMRERSGAGFRIIDNTEYGLTPEEVDTITDVAAEQAIYWNDIECYHWMYDFKACGHWCEGLFNEETMEIFEQENPFDILNINVYE